MPELLDPETSLPEKKRKFTPAQIIMLLLYPVIFIVGLSTGLVIGLKQGKQVPNVNTANTQAPVTIVPNANTNVNTSPTTNANVNVSSVITNTNNALSGGGYLELDAATQASLNQAAEKDKNTLVDQSASLPDIVRQQDLITIKYNLQAYYEVNQSYPSTKDKQIRLDRGASDVLYQALKTFYGGSYNEPIDPEHPTYYYGYTSDGKSFELSAYLTSKSKPFVLTN